MLRIVARSAVARARCPRRSPLTSVTPALSIATSVPGAHRDADVRLRQRRRVVDAVARHRHDAPSLLQRLTTSALSSGSTSAIDSSMPSLRATASAVVVLSPVSITMRRPSACSASIAPGRRRLDRIGDADDRPAAVDRDEHHRLPLGAPPLGALAPAGQSVDAVRSSIIRALPSATAAPSTVPRTPLPVTESKSTTSASASPRSSPRATIAAASGCSLARSRLAASAAARPRRCPAPATTRVTWLALGERAGLVDHQRVDLLDHSSASASLNSTPAGAPARCRP